MTEPHGKRYKVTWQRWDDKEDGWFFAVDYVDHSYDARERIAIVSTECPATKEFRIYDTLRGKTIPIFEEPE